LVQRLIKKAGSAIEAGHARLCRRVVGLCCDRRPGRHDSQALRFGTRRARHPRQRGCLGC